MICSKLSSQGESDRWRRDFRSGMVSRSEVGSSHSGDTGIIPLCSVMALMQRLRSSGQIISNRRTVLKKRRGSEMLDGWRKTLCTERCSPSIGQLHPGSVPLVLSSIPWSSLFCGMTTDTRFLWFTWRPKRRILRSYTIRVKEKTWGSKAKIRGEPWLIRFSPLRKTCCCWMRKNENPVKRLARLTFLSARSTLTGSRLVHQCDCM